MDQINDILNIEQIILSIGHYSIILPSIVWAASFYLFVTNRSHKLANQVFKLGTALIVIHCAVLVIFPDILAGYSFSSFYLLALIGSLLTLIGQKFARIAPLPILTLPLMIIFALLMINPTTITNASSPSFLLSTHIYLALIGQLFALGAFACGAIYFIQHYKLKSKKMTTLLVGVPSLDRLSVFCYRLVLVGFALISLGLITGFVFIQLEQHTINLENFYPKIIWAVIVWSWYFVIIMARNIFNLNYRSLAYMSLIGFGLIILGAFGINQMEVINFIL